MATISFSFSNVNCNNFQRNCGIGNPRHLATSTCVVTCKLDTGISLISKFGLHLLSLCALGSVCTLCSVCVRVCVGVCVCVFGDVKGPGATTDDFDLRGRAGAGAMPRPNARRGRRGTSVPPQEKKEDGPTPEREDFEIVVKCLDTGEELKAGVVNTDVKEKWRGLQLRNLKGRDRFVAFFEKYDPPQIDFIDEMLKNGGKTEEELWYDLQVKYGVNQRGRLMALLRFLGLHNLVNKIDNLLLNYEGREELLIAYYMQKAKPLMEQREASRDPKTWKAGENNTYQMLPGFDLGD